MVKKLVVMLMAVLFSLSVSGVSFAQEKPATTTPPAEKGAVGKAAQPCAGAEKPKKATKKKKKKAAAKKEEAPTMAPEKPAAAPAEKK